VAQIAHSQCPCRFPLPRSACYSQVLASPSLVSLTVERIVCDGLRTLSGSTMGAAAVADLVPKSQLAKGFSGLWSRMGVAIIGGPLLASRLTARQSYKAAIFFAVLTLVNDQVRCLRVCVCVCVCVFGSAVQRCHSANPH
jgi:MFS family permease